MTSIFCPYRQAQDRQDGARLLGVHRHTIGRGRARDAAGGLAALLAPDVPPGQPVALALAVASATQPECAFEQMAGTLVGFWTPPYAKTLNIPGYHLHFLSQDLQHGGHLLQCRGRHLRLDIQRE